MGAGGNWKRMEHEFANPFRYFICGTIDSHLHPPIAMIIAQQEIGREALQKSVKTGKDTSVLYSLLEFGFWLDFGLSKPTRKIYVSPFSELT